MHTRQVAAQFVFIRKALPTSPIASAFHIGATPRARHIRVLIVGGRASVVLNNIGGELHIFNELVKNIPQRRRRPRPSHAAHRHHVHIGVQRSGHGIVIDRVHINGVRQLRGLKAVNRRERPQLPLARELILIPLREREPLRIGAHHNADCLAVGRQQVESLEER